MNYAKAKIPAMPQIAAKALELANAPDVNMKDLVKLLSSDPGITAAILELGNSALFGSHEASADLKILVSRIGLDSLQQILVKRALNEAFPNDSLPPEYDWLALWQHMALTGQIAYHLAKHVRSPRAHEVQVAALLHDVGIFLLGHIAPQTLLKLNENCKSPNKTFWQEEQQFGNELHEKLGQDLASAWNFPIPVVCAIRYHEIHTRSSLPTISDNSMHTLLLVALANILALNHGPRPLGLMPVKDFTHPSLDALKIDRSVRERAVEIGLNFVHNKP